MKPKDSVTKAKNLQKDTKEVTHFIFRIIFRSVMGVFNVLFTILLIGLIAGCVVGSAFLIYVSNHVDADMSDYIMVSSQKDSTTRIYYYDRYGNLVEDESQRLAGGTNQMWIAYEDMPDHLINAFVAIEDKRFWEHEGVDWITTIKATLKYFIPVGENPGGSTITQQLVKNTTGDDDYTIQRKVQEIFRALNLEKDMEKTEILEMYLNTIYLSQGCNGVQAAANTYFGKDASELSLLECAAIAGITQFPTKWDPVQNPDLNKTRRNVILKQMYSQGLITYAEYESAYNKDLILKSEDDTEDSTTTTVGTTTWYTDEVIEETARLLMEKYEVSYEIAVQMIYSGGYSIITAQDKTFQEILDDYFKRDNLMDDTNKVIKKQGSFLVMDHTNGNILALCGGRGEKTDTRLLNRATMTKRQPGSSIKPIAAYAQAMDLGYINYGSVREDTPYNFGDRTVLSNGSVKYSNPKGWPRNSNNRYIGRATMDYALQASKNTVAVKLVSEVGITNCFNFLKEKLHINSLVDSVATTNGVKSDKNLASLGLGGLTYGVTLKEMVAAYCIFPSGGIYHEPRTVLEIRDSTGQVIIDNQNDAEVVIKEGTAQMMIRLMEHVITGSNGTATSARPVAQLVGAAGKTGTTDDNNDRWFVGYTPYFTAGIWVGYDEPQNLGNSNESVRVWASVMKDLHTDWLKYVDSGVKEKKTFADDLLIKAKYCADSGKLISSACQADPRGGRTQTGYFTKDTLPTEACDVHVKVAYCSAGKGIAGPGCPEESIKYYGLLHVKRSFEFDIYVTDAQYTWRDLNGKSPYRNIYHPFYRNVLPSGKYAGRTSGTRQFNCYCQTHN